VTYGSTFLIAEAGVNHNGELRLALELVDIAAKAGVDAVKFQTFRADRLVARGARKAEYQRKTTGDASTQYEMLKALELSRDDFKAISTHCIKHGIQFLSTPFDVESVDFLVNEIGMPIVKLPSGEITNAPLLLRVAATGEKVILSTGMSTIADIEMALGVLAFGYLRQDIKPSIEAFKGAYCSSLGQRELKNHITLLHCTTEYPAPLNEVNLRAMDTMSAVFGLPVGYSDHTTGIACAIAAVARGATVIEKHFTLDRSLPGPDHKASLEPDELSQMTKSIREVEMALGDFLKVPSTSELANIPIARKSVVAACNINRGQEFKLSMFDLKRPGDGIPPTQLWALLGKRAIRDFLPDEMIEL
jgi:N-acetylneuraminate synthase